MFCLRGSKIIIVVYYGVSMLTTLKFFTLYSYSFLLMINRYQNPTETNRNNKATDTETDTNKW